MFRYSIAILATLLLSACTQHPLDSTGTINFSEEKDFDFSSNIYDLEFVALEETSESVFSFPSQVLFSDSTMIVLDDRIFKVLEFSTSGKFIGSIGEKGSGPQEYASPSSIGISDTMLIVCDNGQKKTLCLGLKSRKFIKNLPYMGGYVAPQSNGDIAAFDYFSIQTPKQYLSIYDSTGTQVKWQALPKAIEDGYISAPFYRFTTFNGESFVFPPYDNRMFRILADSCSEYAKFQFGTFDIMPLDVVRQKLQSGPIKLSDDYITYWQPFEIQDYLTVSYRTKSHYYFGVNNYKKHETFYWKIEKGSSDIGFIFTPMGTHNDKFFYIIPAASFLNKQTLKNTEPFQKFIAENNVSDDAFVFVSWRIR